MPNRVFLGVNSSDREKVRAVRAFFKDPGVATFLYEQDLRLGQNWPQPLQQALRECASVAAFVGGPADCRQWPEIGFALGQLQSAD